MRESFSILTDYILIALLVTGFIVPTLLMNAVGQTVVRSQVTTTQQKVIQVKVVHTVLKDLPYKMCANPSTPINYKTYLLDFRCGNLINDTASPDGYTRTFTLVSNDYAGVGKPIPITVNASKESGGNVIFHAWTFNGTVPAPTLRMTEGDHVKLTLANSPESHFSHSIHMHSFHSGPADGMFGPGGAVAPGKNYTYDFVAGPPGVYVYHCHMAPVEEHINRGLYGMLIIDPKTPRPAAAEMVMMLNSYSFTTQKANGTGMFPAQMPPSEADLKKNFTKALDSVDESQFDNQFYSVNGMPFGYIGNNSIQLFTDVPYRIYLANMVEFDPVNSFHMHATMFNYTESGTLTSPKIYTDILTLGQGDRGIVEFSYKYPGNYMFHSHINHFSDLGWMGIFHVSKSNETQVQQTQSQQPVQQPSQKQQTVQQPRHSPSTLPSTLPPNPLPLSQQQQTNQSSQQKLPPPPPISSNNTIGSNDNNTTSNNNTNMNMGMGTMQ